jgi:hypothetical protein
MRVSGLLTFVCTKLLAAACLASVPSIITRERFDSMLSHRSRAGCEGGKLYTYDAFIEATARFPAFGTTGREETSKRELAAFFAQTSHLTSGMIGDFA